MLQVFFRWDFKFWSNKNCSNNFLKITVSKNILRRHWKSRSLSKASIKSIRQKCLIYVSQDKLVKLFLFWHSSKLFEQVYLMLMRTGRLKTKSSHQFFYFFCWKILNLRDINIQAKIYNGSEHILPSNCHHIKHNSFSSATMEFFYC
jgi:hypothetical protein